MTTKLERNVSVGLHDSKTESMLYAAVRSVNGDLVGVIQVVNKTAVHTTSSTEVITEAKTEAKTASEKKTDKIIIPFDSAGEYFKRRERASRNGSTVVDICIPPPSFKPVLLSLSRSPLFKTPKQVFF